MTDKPTVGRILHYVSVGHSLGTYSSTCRAAIVTDVKDETTISLAVFGARGVFFYEKITFDTAKTAGTWHWPERTEGPTSSITGAVYKSPRTPRAKP
jgi:hypothetical protein